MGDNCQLVRFAAAAGVTQIEFVIFANIVQQSLRRRGEYDFNIGSAVGFVIDRRAHILCPISQALQNELNSSRSKPHRDRADAGLPAGHFAEQMGWRGEGLDKMLNDLGRSSAGYGNTFRWRLLAWLSGGLCVAGCA